MLSVFFILAALALQSASVSAACGLEWNHTPPNVEDGWEAYPISTSLSSPRHLVFDSEGALLVADMDDGIIAHNLQTADDGCVTVSSTKDLIKSGKNTPINHGIALSADGKLLFASSPSTVYVWDYDAKKQEVSNKRQVITGMNPGGHRTRTLLVPSKKPDTLLVSMGSIGNYDEDCLEPNGGCSIKVFPIGEIPEEPMDFRKDGEILGWGLRNSVGVGESAEGGIWSVENSIDNAERLGKDIHEENPAEEMNYHGLITNSRNSKKGKNYGYPTCFAVWNNDIPESTLETGEQFVMSPNETFTDKDCQENYEAPAIAFQAHTAPLDVKFFRPDGDYDCDENEQLGGLSCEFNGSAIVTFHGSWNRDEPAGYSVGMVYFENSKPEAKSNERNAVVQMLTAADLSKCPEDCFRPVGIAIDKLGRVFVTSDSRGSLIVLGSAPVDDGQDNEDSEEGEDVGDTTDKAKEKDKSLSTRYEPVQSWMLAALMGAAALNVML